jgi:hypothetical protein
MKISSFVALLLGTVVTEAYVSARKQVSIDDVKSAHDIYMVRLLTVVFDYYIHLEF